VASQFATMLTFYILASTGRVVLIVVHIKIHVAGFADDAV
jgi:hypothetical protein